MLKSLLSIFIFFIFFFPSRGQQLDCNLKPPIVTIHFGTGYVSDINTESLYNYERLSTYCPPDGYYSYASFTSRCFSDDWHTLTEDHTPGDVDGNMLLVNGAPNPGIFLKTGVKGLKPNTNYEFGVWLMNLCKPSDKCPYPLLANLLIRIETLDGRVVAKFGTGDLPRLESPHWTQHRARFQTPAGVTDLLLVMSDNAPGGCGNDFVLDDITFRECVIVPPVVTTTIKKTTIARNTKPSPEKNPSSIVKAAPKKLKSTIVKNEPKTIQTAKPQTSSSSPKSISVINEKRTIFPPAPLILTTRENPLFKRIETEAGEIKIELYDNGEIDDDTVSIYHNNVLIKSHARLSQKPISIKLIIDSDQPHHELIMVAENLGSIPPNTSVMIVTTPSNRYEVFISSSEQKNAKVIFDLRK